MILWQDVKYLATSGFLFLRFFAPAILTPKLFDLRDQHADPQTSRSLLLLAKVCVGGGGGGGSTRVCSAGEMPDGKDQEGRLGEAPKKASFLVWVSLFSMTWICWATET